jgi:hypothetical protein
LKTAFTITLIVVLTLTILYQSQRFQSAEATPPSALFIDNFDGAAIDTSKWSVMENLNTSDYSGYGGSISVENGTATISSDGSSAPYITSKTNPFPSTGEFAVEFDLTYTRITHAGIGMWVSHGPFVVSENHLGANILQVWADTNDGLNIGFPDKDIFYHQDVHWNPYGYWNSSQLIVRLQFSQETYLLYVNGKFIASIHSTLHADTIGFGHPLSPLVPLSYPTIWSAIKIESIKVLPASSLTLSTAPTALEVGFKVDMNGTLIDQQLAPIPDANVIFSYQVQGVEGWNTLNSAVSNAQGNYAAVWYPPATGNYLIKVEWAGNSIYSGTFETKNVSVTAGTKPQTLFMVESNSTLSSITFNSTSKEISFTVSGENGTKGYVRFQISKALMENMSDFMVKLDGNETFFTVTSTDSFYVLYFEYSHSTHAVIISLPSTSPVPEFSSWVLLPLLAAMALLVIALKRRSKLCN